MNQLLLKIDRVRRDDRFFVLFERKKNRRHKIGERLAHAGAGFNHQMSIFLQRACHRHGHLLLLHAELEIFCFRKEPVFGKDRPNSLDKFGAQRIFQRDHVESSKNQNPNPRETSITNPQ